MSIGPTEIILLLILCLVIGVPLFLIMRGENFIKRFDKMEAQIATLKERLDAQEEKEGDPKEENR